VILLGGVGPVVNGEAFFAATCGRLVVIDFPFVIPGASPVSTAGLGAERTDRGGIQSTEHTARFGDKLVWDQRIPEFYAPHTVWAYSLCKALEQIPDLNISPAFSRLYACCFLYYRQHRAELFRAMWVQAKSEGRIKVIVKFTVSVISEVVDLCGRTIVRLRNPRAGGGALRYGPHETISSAFDALKEHINKNGVRIIF